MDKIRNFIRGKWVNAKSNKTIKKYNPTTGKVIAEFPNSSQEDALDAIQYMYECREKSIWMDGPNNNRDIIFTNICKNLESQKEDLAKTLTSETGKSNKEAIAEVNKAIETFRLIQYHGYNAIGENLPSKDPYSLLFTSRMPAGLVVVITPWNFPLYVSAQHIAPAFFCKNSIIFKCSPHAPVSSTNLFKILLKSGVSPDTISLIHGNGENLQALISDKRIDMVSFTGSSKTAQSIAKKRIGRKFIYEGGGNNFMVVLSDSDLEEAAKKAISGITNFSGQKCVSTGGVFIEKSSLESFLRYAHKEIIKIKVGDVNAGADIGPLVGKGNGEELERLIKDTVDQGGKIICGGKMIASPPNCVFLQPTIILVSDKMKIFSKELFAPVLKVVPVESLDEAIKLINHQIYGLSSSIFTNNNKNAITFVKKVNVGMININNHTAGTESHSPFGGIKISGNGFRLGNPDEAIRAFSEVKSIKWDM